MFSLYTTCKLLFLTIIGLQLLLKMALFKIKVCWTCFVVVQSSLKCCGRWWCGSVCVWTPVWALCSWCLFLVCLLSSLCPSCWWWRDFQPSFMLSDSTGQYSPQTYTVYIFKHSMNLYWILQTEIISLSSGWSFRISSIAALASSLYHLPSFSCTPALKMRGCCELRYAKHQTRADLSFILTDLHVALHAKVVQPNTLYMETPDQHWQYGALLDHILGHETVTQTQQQLWTVNRTLECFFNVLNQCIRSSQKCCLWI